MKSSSTSQANGAPIKPPPQVWRASFEPPSLSLPKGGGAIRFVMDYENLPFVEAVRKLAGKYGVQLIEEAGSAESEEKTALRVKLLALHREVAQWWHQLLLRNTLEIIGSNPVFGVGTGGVARAYAERVGGAGTVAQNPHN